MKNGFTLIEILMVTTLSIILMLGAASLFITFLLGNSKVQSSQLVRSEGEHALAQMEFLLRNSVEIVTNPSGAVCDMGMDAITFNSIDGGQTTLMMEPDSSDNNVVKIASNSGIYLTSDSVDISQDLTFNCSESQDHQRRYVEIVFSLRKGTPGVDLTRDIVEQEFRTGVAIRN